MKKVGFLLLFSSFALAGPGQSKPVAPAFTAPGGIKMYYGKAQHQCWSSVSAGHYCTVEQWNCTSVDECFWRLKMNDCCPRSQFGGHSIGFQFLGWYPKNN